MSQNVFCGIEMKITVNANKSDVAEVKLRNNGVDASQDLRSEKRVSLVDSLIRHDNN